MRRLRRRRRLTMTSLIDVIFLLLLFFMLGSTFTRFAEVEFASSGRLAGDAPPERPVFVRLSPERISIDGTENDLAALPEALRAMQAADGVAPPVLIALQGAVTAQRLTDLLVVLRRIPGLNVTILEAT